MYDFFIDDDEPPKLFFSLRNTTISEDGGGTYIDVVQTSVLPDARNVTIKATPVSPAETKDYTLSGSTLTIPAHEHFGESLYLAAIDNDTDAPDKMVIISGKTGDTQTDLDPKDVTLTITDDEDAPIVSLKLSETRIPEKEGESTITASLNHPSSETTTIEVSTDPVSPAVADDFTLSDTTLTIEAGETSSSGSVTITANDNDVEEDDKTIVISGSASNTQGVTEPEDVTLTITDKPHVTLALSNSSITEKGGKATVTASLDYPSSEITTVTVSVEPDSPAVAEDFVVTGTTLTIAAGEESSSGTVTISAIDNDTDAPDKTLTVSGSASNRDGVTDPEDLILTIEDDEDAPAMTLVLGGISVLEDGRWVIEENGGQAAVSANLSHPSSEATTVTVTIAVSSGESGDVIYGTGATLTIPPGKKKSNGFVLLVANDNDVDAPDNVVTVLGSASNSQGVYGPGAVSFAILDDEDTPTVTLELSKTPIPEKGGKSTVTATLSHPSSEVTAVTISATPVPPTVGGDFSLTSNRTLTIAAGERSSKGVVTISAIDSDTDDPDKTVAVSGSASNQHGVTDPQDVTLIITDKPVITLLLSSTSISEKAGETAVSAMLDRPSSATTTITVSATPVSPAVAGDFRLTSNRRLTIAAGAESSSGTVKVIANDNDIDAPDKAITIKTRVTNTQGVLAPAAKTLTIVDDEEAPTVTLALSESSIREDGGKAEVTAALDYPSSEKTTVTVSATPVPPAVAADFTLGERTLTIAAGETTSSGVVTIAANDNDVDAPHKTITIEATASNKQGVTDPSDLALTITDDEVIFDLAGLEDVELPENQSYSVMVTLSGDEPVDAVAWALSGADASLFALSEAADNEATVSMAARDFETPVDADGNNVYQFTLTATDAEDNEASASASITVTDVAEDAAPEQERRLMRSLVSGVARSALDGAVDVIGMRFDAAPGASALSIAGWPVRGAHSPEALAERRPGDLTPAADPTGLRSDATVSDAALLSGSAFTLPLGTSDANIGGDPSWTVWGRGDWRQFEGPVEKGRYDGSLRAGWLGLDARLSERFLTGLAISRGTSETDYSTEENQGRLETALTSIWPYLQMTMHSGGEAQLVLGVGRGEVEHHPADRQAERADLDMVAASVGGRLPVARHGRFTLATTGAVSLAEFWTDGSPVASIGDLKATSWRLRGGVEAEHDGLALTASGWTLQPRVALALRRDGGDGITGTGAELSTGARLSAPRTRFSLNASGHWLALHSESGVREWGASLEARLMPGDNGRGFSLALGPTWGSPQDGVLMRERLFEDDHFIDRNPWNPSLTARAGYGFANSGGLLTPFAEIQLAGDRDDADRYRLGIAFTSPAGLAVKLSGEHRAISNPDTRIGLDLHVRF